jgi:hypothetical protein
MLKPMDRSSLTLLPPPADREQESPGATVTTSEKLAERELEGHGPAVHPPQAGTGQRRGELKESMYRDEPLTASSIPILDSVPGFGLKEAAAFEVGKQFMRLPRPPSTPPPWEAPLDDVDS